ncbi:nucleotide sugar dehydrogenase [Candidatus Peribacteria bacterium]|nr:nucleotide sugar dehydrogenase [Candidatus Peribacteria bacterium]
MKPHQTICVVGLGYVGLPLAHGFAKKGYPTIGYDIDEKRIAELNAGHDRTNELSAKELREVTINFSASPKVIADADIVIVALPTPVDESNTPDIAILKAGTQAVGEHMKKGTIVVFESTVWPGTTEDICGPILEKASGMVCGKDFFLGYSPERINPGDKKHRLQTIVKVVSGQTPDVLETLAALYGSVVEAGIHKAPNIKVAEMAKAIENAQRDLNIAYINEIAMFCGKLGIASKDVLDAASTKWNFLRFSPGLVGGHCIGVDPYYLVEKAKELGMETQVITAGRAVNEAVAQFVADQVHAALGQGGTSVLVLGTTFKEDVPDTRNSKSGDVIVALKKLGHTVAVHDPYMQPAVIERNGWTPGTLEGGPYDAVVLLVPHKEYRSVGTEGLIGATKNGGLVYDLKSILDGAMITKAGRKYLAL